MPLILISVGTNCELTSKKVKHLQAEMYISVTSEIRHMLKDQDVGVSVDMGTVSKISKKCSHLVLMYTQQFGSKCVTVRVYYVSENGNILSYKTHMLAFRQFNPSYALRRSEGLSKSLQAWVLQIFKDFGLKKEQITGAVTDKGNDIAGLARQKVTGAYWEWCMPHMLNKAAQASLGLVQSSRSNQCTNPESARLVADIIRTVYLVKNKSSVGDLWNELGSNGKMLKTFQIHRFLGLYYVMVRLLDMWEQVEIFFEIDQSDEDFCFPLQHDKQAIYQLTCLLHPLAMICLASQRKNESAGFKILKKMHDLKLGLLNPKEQIRDYVDVKKKIGYGMETVKVARNALISAVDSRFFIPRYIDVNVDNGHMILFDVQMFLTPAYSTLEGMKKCISLHCEVNHRSDPDQIFSRQLYRIQNIVIEMGMHVSEPITNSIPRFVLIRCTVGDRSIAHKRRED